MDHYSQIPHTPLRISTSAPQSPHYPKRPSPTSFPGPTGIGAPFVDYRLKPLFPDSQRDDLVSKTEEGIHGEAEYFGSQMMNRRRIPTPHDPRQPPPRSNESPQFALPSRHYADIDQRGMMEPDPREYERRQYAEEMQLPDRGAASYYDARSMESQQQYTPRRYYDEPDTYRRDPREESAYARMPQHHQLPPTYDPSYQRTPPPPVQDRWSGDGRHATLRRSPNDLHDNFLPYEEIPHPSSSLRRDPSDYDRYPPTANPRRAPPEYDRDYQERPMRPLTPPMDRTSPARRRPKSRERTYNRSDSDTEDFRVPQQHKAPREHFFPHHKRRPKGSYHVESDDPSTNSSSSSSEVVPPVRRSRSNGRRRNAGSDIPEALPVFDAVSSSESSDSDLLPVRGRGRSTSRSRDERRVATTKSPHRQPSVTKSKSRHNHYVIDLSNVPTPKRHVTFSPSTEVDYNSVDDLTADGSFTAYGKKGDNNYAQRMADAALLREQSEARHQILQEIRQAMEMRDLSADDSDQEFWQRQISTLNASLRKLTVSFDDPNVRTPSGTRTRHDGRDDVLTSSRHDTDRSTTATSQSSTIVKVRAPDDLAGGHKFTVRVNGKKLVARVPQGGVFKGDTFSIRLPTEAVEQTPSVVKVRAPASLPEGYKFTAKMDDQTIVATVPPGGVKKGEIFTVEVLEYV